MPNREVMTLHAPLGEPVAAEFMQPAVNLLKAFGFKYWVTHADGRIVLMADTPKVWLERGATQDEWDYFWLLYRQGNIEEAQKFAKTGIPRSSR